MVCAPSTYQHCLIGMRLWAAWAAFMCVLACALLSGVRAAEKEAARPAARLSHSGAYVNLDDAADATGVILYVDRERLSVATGNVTVSRVHRRSRKLAKRECASVLAGPLVRGSLEACERVDLAEAAGVPIPPQAPPIRLSPAVQEPDDGILLPLSATLGAPVCASCSDLFSTVVTLSIDRIQRSPQPAERVVYRWWLGHLRFGARQRARWPVAPSEVRTREESGWGEVVEEQSAGLAQAGAGSAPDRVSSKHWDGLAPVRLSGLMENPVLPRSHTHGVYMNNATWSRGISMRLPNGTDDTPDGRQPPIRAPVAGTVIWSRQHVFAKPPFSGSYAGANDQLDWCVMIRDDWGFVYQLFGFDPAASIAARVGQRTVPGTVIGYAPRTPLAAKPPVLVPPAEPPRFYGIEHMPPFPYRARMLHIRVARPDPSWEAYAAPDTPGWTYYNPLHLFLPERAHYRSNIPPFADPARIQLARKPALDVLRSSPVTIASATAHNKPVVSGVLELFAGFQAFVETPGDADDGLDPQALYALEWATVPAYAPEPCKAPERTYWRRTFEHTKLPSGAPDDDPSTLAAHVVPVLGLTGQLQRMLALRLESQFDEKERSLVYAVTRTTRGEPDLNGAWDTRRERHGGPHHLAVRARDFWGNAECVGTRVVLDNSSTRRDAQSVLDACAALLRAPSIQQLMPGLPAVVLYMLRHVLLMLERFEHVWRSYYGYW